MRCLFGSLLTLLLLTIGDATACLWDSDTILMERQRFPSAHELIAGHFLRHSPAYYEWRIQKISGKRFSDRSATEFDDLAVAYDKLGRHDEAIETIRQKMERWPDDFQYESEANLGTFLIHDGRFEEGVVHIQNAIQINPDAHFGREVYQKLLVEYVIQQRSSGATLPLSASPFDRGFSRYLKEHLGTDGQLDLKERRAAVTGILGMMRFGNHESPILLEALGDLCLSNVASDSKMLAARAYLKASYATDDPTAREAYRSKAENAIEMQEDVNLQVIEGELESEIIQAKKFFQQIAKDEAEWIAAGDGVDAEFAIKYYKEPTLNLNGPATPGESATFSPFSTIVFGSGVVVAIFFAGYMIGKKR